MKLEDGKITMLFSESGATLELKDSTSSITFVKVKLSTKEVCQMLSRLSYTTCESMEVFNLDKLNKKMEHKYFEFRIRNNGAGYIPYNDQIESAKKEIKKICPKGWEPDYYFESRDSFFMKDGQQYAKCIIRRWV